MMPQAHKNPICSGCIIYKKLNSYTQQSYTEPLARKQNSLGLNVKVLRHRADILVSYTNPNVDSTVLGRCYFHDISFFFTSKVNKQCINVFSEITKKIQCLF